MWYNIDQCKQQSPPLLDPSGYKNSSDDEETGHGWWHREACEEGKKQRTCAEQQQDLHAQVLVVGHLQPDELAGDLQHLLTLVGHVGQLHPVSGGEDTAQQSRINVGC